jgi:hypothetical protein
VGINLYVSYCGNEESGGVKEKGAEENAWK